MPPKLKICQLYHEKLFLQKVNVELVSKLDTNSRLMTCIPRFLHVFFSASYIMEAARGLFCLYGMKVA